VEHEHRRGDRRGSADAGDLHADRGFRARLQRVRRQAATQVRGELSLRQLDHLGWPFFTDAHRALARELDAWCASNLNETAAQRAAAENETGAPRAPAENHVDEQCRSLVKQLGDANWLTYCVPAAHGGAFPKLDVRALCLCRETLAQHSGLADFAFAMQGLGAGPISLFGSEELKERYLPGVRDGARIAAFALSEPDAGSDVTAMKTTARRVDKGWRIDGTKSFISNGGIADFYVVFARLPDDGEKAFGAFVVDANNPGLRIAERIATIAPHPLATLAFSECRVRNDAMVGAQGKGMRVALGTLDVFRSTVAAAALGFARRALHEAVAHAKARTVFGKPLAEHQLTRAKLADMALAVDASALLVYRAAWTRDTVAERVTREAAMAKLHATEAAQRVIDDAVQLLGARGVVSGAPVERLYREIRALRIYEGTSEIQRLVIADAILADSA
jgi:acyl-CoA dehydrogenase